MRFQNLMILAGLFAGTFAHAEIKCSIEDVRGMLTSLGEAEQLFDFKQVDDQLHGVIPNDIQEGVLPTKTTMVGVLIFGDRDGKRGLIGAKTNWFGYGNKVASIKVDQDQMQKTFARWNAKGTEIAPLIKNSRLVEKLAKAQNCEEIRATLENYKIVMKETFNALKSLGSLLEEIGGSANSDLSDVCNDKKVTVLSPVLSRADSVEERTEILSDAGLHLTYFSTEDATGLIGGAVRNYLDSEKDQRVYKASRQIDEVYLEKKGNPNSNEAIRAKAEIAKSCAAVANAEQDMIQKLQAADAAISKAVQRMANN